MGKEASSKDIRGKRTENGYIRRPNEEIYEFHQKPPRHSIIKRRRLQWLGHIERMAKNRTVRTIAWKTSEYTKRRGRPRKRCRETVLEDLKDKGIHVQKKLETYNEALGLKSSFKIFTKIDKTLL